MNFFISLYCWTVIALLTALLGVFAVLSSFLNSDISHKTAKLWGLLIIKLCGIKVNLIKYDDTLNLKKSCNVSYIITSNHQSYFDIFVLLAYLDLDFRFIAKKSLFKIPFLGQSMKRLGYIPIDRKDLRSALKSVKAGAEALKNKTSILIFPKGRGRRTENC